ncbi:hypothetical protein BCR37DRAFT_389130 [Protomyces lactucae-debilis]|uniref:Uncharacterized protein n=1 Tax=Protomyces lactucae-debilis TaxID=2754530 RepID=A0A1Y2F0D8_PROLT|nr:uncharacterized protein BCR37DRAFT_389130 [Protomyces lactucae-debilis]ORY77303.1 hypothetical protein BCR37DRAFT_389130 [Protomyces lactucae-debilis]
MRPLTLLACLLLYLLQSPAVAESAVEKTAQSLNELTLEIQALRRLVNRTYTENLRIFKAQREIGAIARMQCIVPAFTFANIINAWDNRGCSYWCLKAVTEHRDAVDHLDPECFVSNPEAPWFMMYYNLQGHMTEKVITEGDQPWRTINALQQERFAKLYPKRVWDRSHVKQPGMLPDYIDEKRPPDRCMCNFTLMGNRMYTPLSNPRPWSEGSIMDFNACTLPRTAAQLAIGYWQSESYSYVQQHVACDEYLRPENYSVPGLELPIVRTGVKHKDRGNRFIDGRMDLWRSISLVFGLDTPPLPYL